MKREEAEREMLDGYRDGFDLSNPEPSGNRSLSYMHGFRNGRADKAGYHLLPAKQLRERAEQVILADINAYTY